MPRAFSGTEGVLLLGKAQEKVTVFRTEERTAADGKKYALLVKNPPPVSEWRRLIADCPTNSMRKTCSSEQDRCTLGAAAGTFDSIYLQMDGSSAVVAECSKM